MSVKNMFNRLAGGSQAGNNLVGALNKKGLDIGLRLLEKEHIIGLNLDEIAEIVEVEAQDLAAFREEKADHPDICRSFDYALVFDVAQDDWKEPEDELERVDIKVHPLEYDLLAMGAHPDYVDTILEKAQKKVEAAKRAGQTARLNPKRVSVVKKDWFAIETFRMIQAIEQIGYQTKVYRSWDLKTIVCLVGVGEYTLRQMAAYRRTDLEIDAKESVRYARTQKFQLALFTDLGGEDGNQGQEADKRAEAMAEAGAVDEDDEEAFLYKIGLLGLCCGHPTGHVHAEKLPLSNWQHMFVQYRHDAPQQIYKHYVQIGTEEETIFDDRTRLRLIYEGLIADDDDKGCEFTFEEYLLDKSHPLKACFPLIHKEDQEELMREWVKNCNPFMLLSVPLPKVRAYLGEGPAFYFAFLQYYTLWLFVPGVLGPIFGIVQQARNEVGFAGIEVLSLAVIFWSVAFVDFWKRRESDLRLQWGMTKYQEKAVARPQFKGDYFIDSVTGEFEETFGAVYVVLRQLFSVSIAMLLLCGAVSCVFGVLFVRDSDPNNQALSIGMGIVNGVQISLFDYGYTIVSAHLNDFENHRTQQDYENAKIGKAFFFRFVNSFNSLFYIAYIQNQFSPMGKEKSARSIMGVLLIQLIMLFATAIVIQNSIEILLPPIWAAACGLLSERANEDPPEGADKQEFISPAEEQALKLPYEDTLQDMSEMVIQYGYVTLFVVAFPFTPTLAILNNLLEMKVDASNLVSGVQRPHLRGAYGLGVWNIILEVVGIVAVINNVGLYTFLTQQGINVSGGSHDVHTPTRRLGNARQILFFVIISVVLVLLAVIEKVLISDEPYHVEKGIERQRIIENVLVLRARMGTDTEDLELMEDGQTESQENGPSKFSDKVELGKLENYLSVFGDNAQ